LFAAVLFAVTTTTYIATTGDTSDASTYTYTDVGIGTAAASRCVVVSLESRKAVAAASTVTSVTIGGSVATILKQAQVGVTSTNLVAIASLLVPSGTTATVVWNLDQTMSRAQNTVHTVVGMDATSCTTPIDSGSQTGVINPAYAIDVPAGGAAFGSCAAASGGIARTATWGNITETYEVGNLDGALAGSGAAADYGSAQTDLSVQCTFSGSSAATETVGAFVSLGAGTVIAGAPRGGYLLNDIGR
jgi:hypothetical protein